MEISKIDSILLYLSKQDSVYKTSKQIQNDVDMSLDGIIDVLELLEEDKYIRREDHVPKDSSTGDLLKYWKITIKGELLLDNNGYQGIKSRQRKETVLRWSLTIASWIVGCYALVKLLIEYVIPSLSCG